MENEVIKQAFRFGNSAGIILPISWKDKKVVVKLIEKSISQEIIEILEEADLLKNTVAIFLAGSYARGEETESSDIDIMIITDIINKQIKKGKYEIIFISKKNLDESIKKNIYLASLINEAKAILNVSLLEDYKEKIKEISIKKSLDEIKSMTRINEKMIIIDEESKKNVLDETIYSLVLRLRELYLIECIKNSKKPTNKEFLNLIKKVGSNESYNAYLRIKNNLKSKTTIPTTEAKSLISEIKKRIKDLENGKKS